ncbi:hypothetical protein NAF17_01945 [Mucilaginibacter sp. RB4R14]|uniref:hypothetical protein n=1 Tax=Mucilaginibacter aurantiaciroseus TaxID=2949308 RepID=UPI00209080F3|nr:hypothetical protein [Mucilaginibacter aurantiaciroseus]MCO5934288.1 hypothetical protein [Mucilaginibacter aurantiaciroseus]
MRNPSLLRKEGGEEALLKSSKGEGFKIIFLVIIGALFKAEGRGEAIIILPVPN